MAIKKTNEQYIRDLEQFNKENNTNIKLKDGMEYINNRTKITHICSCGKEWNIRPTNILHGKSKCCEACNSFAQWGLDNLGEDFLEKYWDYEKNNKLGIDPWKITCGLNTKVFIYCQKISYHDSYDIAVHKFVGGGRCSYCHSKKIHPKDSFAQYLIDTYGENALELYWDYGKNKNINPYELSKKSHTKALIKCQEKDYHGSYDISCADFVVGNRCPYCSNRHGKVHPLDSLGTLYPQVLDIWSDKNKKSAYEYSIKSQQKVWFKCPEGKHKDYEREIYNALNCDFRCPDCSHEQKDSIMATTLKQVLKHEYPDTEWEYDAGFRTSKNYVSRYDIFVPYLNNLLIECQSEYHDDSEQQKLDRLKKQYAIDNSYNYLAIDKRDYTPLQAIQIFFPEIKDIPDYIDISKNTSVYWDIAFAQKLINEYHPPKIIAKALNISYSTLQGGIVRGNLKLPKDYRKLTNSKNKNIVCLTKTDKYVDTYSNFTKIKKDFNNRNDNINIVKCLTGKIKTAYGYKWRYYDEYLKSKNNNKINA